MRKIGAAALAACLALPGAAQNAPNIPVRVLKLEPNQVTVGDPVDLVLHVPHPPSMTVQRVEAQADGKWEPLEQKVEPAPEGGSTLRMRWAAFGLGQDIPLPALKIWLQEPGGEPFYLEPSMPSVSVVSVLKEGEEEIAGVKPPLALPFEMPWKLAAALAGVAALAAALWWWWRKRRRAAQGLTAPAEPAVPPYEEAVAALERLAAAKRWETERFRSHYDELSYVMRRYVERRYGLPVLERTTQEIAPMFRFHPSLRSHADALREVLNLCDAVKFAKHRPGAEEGAASLKGVREFVEATKPQPAPSGEEEAVSAGGGAGSA